MCDCIKLLSDITPNRKDFYEAVIGESCNKFRGTEVTGIDFDKNVALMVNKDTHTLESRVFFEVDVHHSKGKKPFKAKVTAAFCPFCGEDYKAVSKTGAIEDGIVHEPERSGSK